MNASYGEIKMIQKQKKSNTKHFMTITKTIQAVFIRNFRKLVQLKALANNLPYRDTFIKDSLDIANEFNDFLVNVASKLKGSVTNTNHTKLK